MNRSFKRTLAITMAAVSLIAGAAVYAGDDSTAELPTIHDGRINEFDINATVVIYENYVYPYEDDVNMGVLDSIEFWMVNSDGLVVKAMEVPASVITSAEVTGDTSVLIAAENGVALYKEVDGSLTVVGVPQSDGTAYHFNWTPSL
ncbi:MAG: hypothetical protein U0670_12710 [Anaerolineae bacterium]